MYVDGMLKTAIVNYLDYVVSNTIYFLASCRNRQQIDILSYICAIKVVKNA
jgi:hypothetical protein